MKSMGRVLKELFYPSLIISGFRRWFTFSMFEYLTLLGAFFAAMRAADGIRVAVVTGLRMYRARGGRTATSLSSARTKKPEWRPIGYAPTKAGAFIFSGSGFSAPRLVRYRDIPLLGHRTACRTLSGPTRSTSDYRVENAELL